MVCPADSSGSAVASDGILERVRAAVMARGLDCRLLKECLLPVPVVEDGVRMAYTKKLE